MNEMRRWRGIRKQALVLFLALLPLVAGAQAELPEWLTEEERSWLLEHPHLRLGVDPAYPPYSFRDESGSYAGIAVDFTRALLAPLGIETEIVPGLSWPQILDAARNRALDLILTAVETPERHSYLAFSRIYLPTPLVVMVRDDYEGIRQESDLDGKRIALVREYSSSRQVLAEHPDIVPVEVATPLDGLWAVSSGQADAYVGVLGINVYLAGENGITNLRVAARYGDGLNGQRFAVRKDWAPLARILDKALQAMPRSEKRAIFARWLPIYASGLEQEARRQLGLTAREMRWINGHPVLRLATATHLPPLSFTDASGRYQGICADYLNKITALLGLSTVPAEPQGQLGAAGDRYDLYSCALAQESDQTDPGAVILTRLERVWVRRDDTDAEEQPSVSSGRVAVQRGTVHHQWLQTRGFQNVQVYPTTDAALDALARGEADYFLGDDASAAWSIHQLALRNLRMQSAPEADSVRLELRVPGDRTPLASALTKAVAAISAQEAGAIAHRWTPVTRTTQDRPAETDYSPLMRALAVALAFIMVTYMLLKLGRRRNLEDEQLFSFGSTWHRRSGVLLMALFITLISVLSWLALNAIYRHEVRQVRSGLTAVLNATHEGTKNWFRLTVRQLELLANDPRVLELADRFSADTAPAAADLQAALARIRTLVARPGAERYALLSPEGTVLFASDGMATGTRHPIAEDLQAMRKLHRGSAVLSPARVGQPAALYVAVPLRVAPDPLAAILVAAYPPDSLSQITRSGRLGRSGETYLFDRSGRLLTQSRFPGLLSTLGLAGPDGSELFRLRLEEPVQQDEGLTTGSGRLTRMAAAATAGISGEDFAGYTGYLGEPVVGVWRWDEALGVGIATEQHRQEALETYAQARSSLLSLLATALGLAIFGTVFLLLLSERTNRALRAARARLEERVAERTRQLTEARSAAERASQAKSVFLANMSHEIRTPMNAIIGLAHLCLQTELTGRQQDYLNKIIYAARSLLGIISDILDFSRIEANRLDLEEAPFDLEEVLSTLATMVAVPAQEKGLELVFLPPPEETRRLVGDPLRLGQILINLTTNAVKFTDEGEIRVETEVVERSDRQILLRFKVSDTGIGIPEDRLEELFHPFSQADSSTTRRFGGSGLGLAISRKLARLMEGSLSAQSCPGRGSTFILTCRLGVEEKSDATLLPPSLQGLRVLVVDDSATVRAVMEQMLAAQRFKVDTAAAGEQALTMLEQRSYGLVILDWKMPGMDGVAVTRKIHARFAGSPPLVVMITAHAREELIREAEGAGVHHFLVKPVTPSQLLDTILTLFAGDAPRDRGSDGTPAPRPDLRGRLLLLAEDHPVNQQVAIELIEQTGARVITAENGREAVKLAAERRPDLILMDVQMPEMDGYQATRELRRTRETREIPIIAMTAGALVEDRERCLAAGMNDYLAKPVEPALLYQKLAAWLNADAPEGAAGEDQPLPDIAGMDVRRGHIRSGMDSASYLRVLGIFARHEADFTARFEAACAADDRETARRLAHSLKGAAAIVGVDSVAEMASELEERIVRGDSWEEVRAQATRLGRKLAPILDNLAALGEAEGDSRKTLEQQQDEPLAQLRRLIASHDYAALALAEALLAGPEIERPSMLEEVCRALRRFDFEQAARLLDSQNK